jgi:hypothetical protein
MQTFAMITTLARQDVRDTARRLEEDVMRRIEADCPDVEWLGSYAVLGRCDYLDLFRARDCEQAFQVATIVRAFGHAQTETWPIVEWDSFKHLAHQIGA